VVESARSHEFRLRKAVRNTGDNRKVVCSSLLNASRKLIVTSLEPEKLASLIGRQHTGSIPFDREGFQSFTRRVRVLGQVVGKLDGDLPRKRVAGRETIGRSRNRLWEVLWDHAVVRCLAAI
jgi:hypothetical protein